MRPLTNTQIAELVIAEIPDEMRHSPVVDRGIRRLLTLTSEAPQIDIDGLHSIVDLHLTPAVLVSPSADASTYISYLAAGPGRAPLAMKLAALMVLDPGR